MRAALRPFAISLAFVALACVKLNDIFDCAALCDNRPHAQTRCNAAGCVFQSCDLGYADCNNDMKDGCEVDLRSDPSNCGVCSSRCLATDCNLGSCWPVESLIEPTPLLVKMVIDGDDIYFARYAGSSTSDAGADAAAATAILEKLSISSRMRQTLATGFYRVDALATDQDAVYVLDRPYGVSASDIEVDRVLRVAKAGGNADALAMTNVASSRLVVDATNVYWGSTANSGVGFVAKTGGTTNSLPDPTLPDPTYALSPVHDLALQAGRLYLASDGGLGAIATIGGDFAILAGGGHVSRVVADGAQAYFLSLDPQTSTTLLRTVPLAGGDAAEIWRDPKEHRGFPVQALALDLDFVYLITLDGVARVEKATGAQILLAGAQPFVTDLAVDADYVYWCGGVGIRRLAKQHIAR